MSKQVATAQKAFHSAKNDFFKLAAKTDKAITKERNALRRKLKQANNKLRKTRTKLVAEEKKLQKSSTAAAKSQVKKMNKLLDEAKSEAMELRETLHEVGERVKASKVKPALNTANSASALVCRSGASRATSAPPMINPDIEIETLRRVGSHLWLKGK